MMKFPLGRLVITPIALSTAPLDDICAAIDCHVCGEWGDVPDLVRVTNETGLLYGGCLHSVYRAAGGTELRVLTTRDRLTTTVYLPGESVAGGVL